MSNPKKPTQRPQKGRVRPANKPSASGETGPAPEVPSGCLDSKSQEVPNTGALPYLDLLLKCERHVIDAINDETKLKDEIVHFRSHLPGLLYRLWELQSEKLAITQYLLDSSAKVVEVCEAFPDLSATQSESSVTHGVYQDLAVLELHEEESLSELQKAINNLMNSFNPMTPD